LSDARTLIRKSIQENVMTFNKLPDPITAIQPIVAVVDDKASNALPAALVAEPGNEAVAPASPAEPVVAETK
jgi:hypothetical protein